jgi:hypothetical protein
MQQTDISSSCDANHATHINRKFIHLYKLESPTKIRTKEGERCSGLRGTAKLPHITPTFSQIRQRFRKTIPTINRTKPSEDFFSKYTNVHAVFAVISPCHSQYFMKWIWRYSDMCTSPTPYSLSHCMHSTSQTALWVCMGGFPYKTLLVASTVESYQGGGAGEGGG